MQAVNRWRVEDSWQADSPRALARWLGAPNQVGFKKARVDLFLKIRVKHQVCCAFVVP